MPVFTFFISSNICQNTSTAKKRNYFLFLIALCVSFQTNIWHTSTRSTPYHHHHHTPTHIHTFYCGETLVSLHFVLTMQSDTTCCCSAPSISQAGSFVAKQSQIEIESKQCVKVCYESNRSIRQINSNGA